MTPDEAEKCPKCGADDASATLLGEIDRWLCGSYRRHTGEFCQEDGCRITELEAALAQAKAENERLKTESIQPRILALDSQSKANKAYDTVDELSISICGEKEKPITFLKQQLAAREQTIAELEYRVQEFNREINRLSAELHRKGRSNND